MTAASTSIRSHRRGARSVPITRAAVRRRRCSLHASSSSHFPTAVVVTLGGVSVSSPAARQRSSAVPGAGSWPSDRYSANRRALEPFGRARKQRQERTTRRVRPPRAAIEPRRNPRALERVLEQAVVVLRRAHQDRHLVERHAARASAASGAQSRRPRVLRRAPRRTAGCRRARAPAASRRRTDDGGGWRGRRTVDSRRRASTMPPPPADTARATRRHAPGTSRARRLPRASAPSTNAPSTGEPIGTSSRMSGLPSAASSRPLPSRR